MIGAGQEFKMIFTIADNALQSAAATTQRTIVDAILKKIKLSTSGQCGSTGGGNGFWGVKLVKQAYGSPDDIGIDPGLFYWIDNFEERPIHDIGGSAVKGWLFSAHEAEQHNFEVQYDTYHPIYKGQGLTMIMAGGQAIGTDGDFEATMECTFEVACRKRGHPNGPNWKSAYNFQSAYVSDSSKRWFWVAPCDCMVKNIEAFIRTDEADEVNAMITKSKDTSATTYGYDSGEQYVKDTILFRNIEMIPGTDTVRQYHPAMFFRQGEVLRFEKDFNGALWFNAEFVPFHKAPIKFDMAVEVEADYFLVEFPMTMALYQVLIDGSIDTSASGANAAINGYIEVTGPYDPIDISMAFGDIEASAGMGSPTALAFDGTGGTGTNLWFQIPYDMPAGIHERYQQVLQLPGSIVKEGQYIGIKGGADMSSYSNFTLRTVGYVLNKGKPYRTRSYTTGNYLRDLTVEDD